MDIIVRSRRALLTRYRAQLYNDFGLQGLEFLEVRIYSQLDIE